MEKTVVELFAGVGGFRVGLNDINQFDMNGRAIENGSFKFVWMNQWEPSTKVQYAYDCYTLRFGQQSETSNIDIKNVDKKSIPNHNLLCAGFPCQDYSVARSLSTEQGILGQKGVLWWQIRDVLLVKKPSFVLLENVDRLLKSPSKQRGRDFGIILYCFTSMGYVVEWRVINAAKYGYPQKRRRVYIFAYKKKTSYGKYMKQYSPNQILTEKGLFTTTFPIISVGKTSKFNLNKSYDDIFKVSDNFAFEFENSGICRNGVIYTLKTQPIDRDLTTLGDLILDNAAESYYLTEEEIQKFNFLRSSKHIPRVSKNGFSYIYSEGAMSEYDSLELPGRTLLTSEKLVNRSTHIIMDPYTRRLRYLTPIECERLNQFPDNWTNTGMPERKRYFMMGNALVTGIINELGQNISQIMEKE